MSRHTTLVSPRELAAHLEHADWRIFDCRHDLADTGFGERAYAESHILGAQFLHLDRDLSGPLTGANGRHPLPDPEAFAELMGRCGVDANTQVVAYDDAGGMFASRVWWMLQWLGHEGVAVLDGGLQNWIAEGLPLSAARPQPRPARFQGQPKNGRVDAAYILRHLRQPDVMLLDARSPDRFRGENERLDPVGGHIPGARNRFFRDNLEKSGRFKPAGQLRREFEALLADRPPHQVIHHCGSGVTACHNLLAMEIAGLGGSRLYPGSWSEWCTDPARPIALGPAE